MPMVRAARFLAALRSARNDSPSAAECPADKMVQGPIRTYPAAEETPEKQGRSKEYQGPEQAAINGVRGQGRSNGDQRVDIQKHTQPAPQTGQTIQTGKAGQQYKCD